MSLFDAGYFSDAIDYAQKKLGVDTGANAVQTVSDLYKSTNTSAPAQAAVASASAPSLSNPVIFGGMTQKQLLMVGGAIVVLLLVMRGRK